MNKSFSTIHTNDYNDTLNYYKNKEHSDSSSDSESPYDSNKGLTLSRARARAIKLNH